MGLLVSQNFSSLAHYWCQKFKKLWSDFSDNAEILFYNMYFISGCVRDHFLELIYYFCNSWFKTQQQIPTYAGPKPVLLSSNQERFQLLKELYL